MVVVATWPNVANSIDMVANGDFQPRQDTTPACGSIEMRGGPGDEELQELKNLIQQFCGSQFDDRGRPINRVGERLSKYIS